MVSQQLLAWALGSVAVGAGLLLWGDGFWYGFGVQTLVWGAIDGAIAVFGSRDRQQRMARGEHHHALQTEAFGARLKRLLRINAGLDVMYVIAGFVVMLVWSSDAGRGHGWGIVVQGLFLLFFDAFHGWRARYTHGNTNEASAN